MVLSGDRVPLFVATGHTRHTTYGRQLLEPMTLPFLWVCRGSGSREHKRMDMVPDRAILDPVMDKDR